MTTQSSLEPTQIQGPSGFIEYSNQMLVVDYGRVYMDGSPIGFLFEDGYLKDTSGILGTSPQPKLIDDIRNCVFRGIDASGLALELPGMDGGPTGALTYNGVPLNVINGRVARHDHRLVGEFDDDGRMFIRDSHNHEARRQLDENTQLNTTFVGEKSNGDSWKFEFVRPLARKDKPYSENEIIRYFQEYDKLTGQQKKYTIDSLRLWAQSGLLQVVRKSEGNCMLGNIKHGAAGVTGVRTGYVTLDRDEFIKEIELFRQFGSLAVAPHRLRPYLEVRANLVVSHEFGHQVEFCLSQATQERLMDIYKDLKKRCEKNHRIPGYDGLAELLESSQVSNRHFISGYARASYHEYWAECLAVFSVKEGRDKLKIIDPAIHELLRELILAPQNLIRRVFHDSVMDLQASLRVGGEFHDDLLNV
jgi:hypothetical protein